MEEESEITAVDKVLGNTDLLSKILQLVLPPKQLFISKAVSNHWLSIISDPHFILDYSRRLRASQPPSQFYCFTQPLSLDETIPKIDGLEGIRPNVTPKYYNLEIVDSCNGLLLCHHGYSTPLYVVNPTTKKHRLIPDPNGYIWFSAHGTFLAFDPSKSIHYKVVSFRLPLGQRSDHRSFMLDIPFQEIAIHIFSSEYGLWKRISLQAPPGWMDFSTRKVFWRGAIHGINFLNFHVQFHIEEERFSWNQTTIDPNTLPESKRRYYIEECDKLSTFWYNMRFQNVDAQCRRHELAVQGLTPRLAALRIELVLHPRLTWISFQHLTYAAKLFSLLYSISMLQKK